MSNNDDVDVNFFLPHNYRVRSIARKMNAAETTKNK